MVVVIIGVLAALAIPAYQNHVIRAKVSEGLGLASPAKIAIHESVVINGSLPANQAETFYTSPDATEHVSSVLIAGDGTGVITISYHPSAGGGTIILNPSVDAERNISWTCTGGTLLDQFRPANCR